MILMGDELSRSQAGNNNAYCQDNETSWLDWDDGTDPQLLPYVRNLITLRKSHAVFRRLEFFSGEAVGDSDLKDIYWLAPDGREMNGDDWGRLEQLALGMQIGNEGASEERILILFNASEEEGRFSVARRASRRGVSDPSSTRPEAMD